MARTPRDVTEAELAILQVLWEQGEATVRQLAEQLYSEGRSSEHATVQKLLGRLENKACVSRDRSCWPHRYSAAIDREELIQRRLQATADELCQGSLTPVLTQLVQSERLSARDRRSLRDLLEELDDKSKKKRR